jgi:peptide/nickel transport system permease protein
MNALDWIPGLGHWRIGRRRTALILAGFLALFVGLGAANAAPLADAAGRILRRARGEPVAVTARHVDFVVSGLLLLALAAGLFVLSGRLCRRARREAAGDRPRSESHWKIAFRQFRKNRLAVAGSVILLGIYLVALLAPLVAPYDPAEQGDRVRERLLPPSAEHPLGTDKFARDALSRIVYGSRISLLVGFLAVGITVTIGTVYGAISGYCGGRVDNVMMRIVDVLLCFPTIILIITVIALWRHQSIWIIITVIGLTSWMGVARLVRGEFLVLKELDYAQAARALGTRPPRLIFRHLLPNAMTPVIVAATLQVGSTILLEAGLSFLGLGVQPPTPSWGNIVYDTKGNIFSEWWLPLSAGTAILITVVGYNLVGDGLRDALDPRLRQ